MSARLCCEGRELGKLVDLLDDVVVDEDRTIEVLPALNDAVTDGVDLVERFDGLIGSRCERFENERHGVVVIVHLRVDDGFVLIETVLVERPGGTDAFANSLRKNLMRLNVDKLVLQRR